MTKSLQMTRGGALLTRGEERLAGDPGHGGGVWGCSSSQGVGIAPSDWPLAWMGVSGSRDLELSQCSSCTPSLIVVATSGRASEERMNQHHHRRFLLRLLLARDLPSKLAAATVPAALLLGRAPCAVLGYQARRPRQPGLLSWIAHFERACLTLISSTRSVGRKGHVVPVPSFPQHFHSISHFAWPGFGLAGDGEPAK